LTFRSLSETFVRRSCSILLSVLATVVMRRSKKSVVHVAQCIAALVPVHRTPPLLSDVQCFLNPSATSRKTAVHSINREVALCIHVCSASRETVLALFPLQITSPEHQFT